MRAHLTPIVGAQPLPWPHEPTQMGENYDEVERACAGASWFMGRCKAHWTKDEHAAESLRRENETLARKIKREALKAKTLLAVIAALVLIETTTGVAADSLTPVALVHRSPSPSYKLGENFGSNRRGLTTTLTASAGVDHPSLPSPALLVGENLPMVIEGGVSSIVTKPEALSDLSHRSYITERFLDAVATIESSRNPAAIGDGGKATGEFQLHQAARQDARKLLGRAGTDRELAAAYLANLAKRLEAKLGRKPSYGQIYAAYNMGYVGFSRRGFDVSKTPATTQRACKRIEGMMK